MPVPNPAAAAVDVHNAVDFAAALHTWVKGWTEYKNIITVDAEAGCVSYQQDDECIIFSCNTPQVQFVRVEGLPRSFIGAEQAQQVRRDAREMKPDQNTNVQPLAAPTSNRKHASPRLPSSAAPQQPQALLTARAHYLQPPPQLAFKLPPRLLELASLQPWCHGNNQRLRLLIICRPLSVVAFRLARAINRREGSRSLELRAMGIGTRQEALLWRLGVAALDRKCIS